MIRTYKALFGTRPILSIEDGLNEEAWEDWRKWRLIWAILRNWLATIFWYDECRERLKRGIDEKAGNAILIKPDKLALAEDVQAG